MIEIERKFLVHSTEYKAEAMQQFTIQQGYLNSAPNRSVRVRTKGDKAYLTIKGTSNAAGTSRYEWEKEISIAEAEDLLLLCEPGMIQKIRYEVLVANTTSKSPATHIFEVDAFFGDNEGLVIAEVELQTEDETFHKPDWLGKEVTGDSRYYNASLSRTPFKNW